MARMLCAEAVRDAPDGYVVEIKPPTRTLKQNATLWGVLTDISKQVCWYGNILSEEDWKDMLTAGLKQSRVVPGIGGGFVVLGTRTRDMTKEEFSELLEFSYAFGAEQGVTFRDDKEQALKFHEKKKDKKLKLVVDNSLEKIH